MTATAERIARHQYDARCAAARRREWEADQRAEAEYREADRIRRRVRRNHGPEGEASVARLVDKVTNRPRPVPLVRAWEWAEACYERGDVLT